MIEWIVSSSVLIAALLLLRLLFRGKISARLQYALWALVLLRLLIPVSLVDSAASVSNLLSSVTEKPVVQAASGTLTPQVSYDLAVREILDTHDYSQEVYAALPEAQQEQIIETYQPQIQQRLETYETAYDAARILKTLWLVGAAVMGLFLLVSNFRFYGKLRRTRARLDISASLPVYRSSATQTPCLFGLFRPSVYLPDTDVDENAMSCILAHEQTHYRHLDHIWALARCICLALHWYNPLVWLAVKASRADSELACDEGTLAKLGNNCRESYGRTLIEMSCGKPSVADYLLTSTTMTADKKTLRQRIQAIAKKQKVILAAVISLAAAVLILVGCTFTGAGSGNTESPSEEPTVTPTQPTEQQPTEPPATEPQPTDAVIVDPPVFPWGDTGAATDGALRCLPLDIGVNCTARLWGDTVLLYDDRTCQVRSLRDGSLLAEAPGAGGNTVSVTEDYMIYYLPQNQTVVFRDHSLQTVKSVEVNVDAEVAEMLFSPDGRTAYYHIYPSNTIIELDIQTGEKREIPVDGAPILMLSGLEFEGSVLRYWGKENNEDYWAFVDLKTGKYLGKDPTITRFQSWDGGYYLCRAENGKVFDQRIVSNGTGNGIMPQDRGTDFAETWALPQLDSFFTLSFNQEGSTVTLDLYKRTTDKCTASLTVDLGQQYQHSGNAFVDPSGQFIWLCLKVGTTDNYQMVLYRWDFQANATA